MLNRFRVGAGTPNRLVLEGHKKTVDLESHNEYK